MIVACAYISEFMKVKFARLHGNWTKISDCCWFDQSFLKRIFVGLKKCYIGDTDLAES